MLHRLFLVEIKGGAIIITGSAYIIGVKGGISGFVYFFLLVQHGRIHSTISCSSSNYAGAET
jgi:hypothetical protein